MSNKRDPARDACSERCAYFGDPPCWEIVDPWEPCDDCLSDIGAEVVIPIDSLAAVRPLL